MSAAFSILLVLTLIIGVATVVKPGSNKKTGEPFRRKHLATGFGILAIVLFVLVGITAPKQSTVKLQSQHD